MWNRRFCISLILWLQSFEIWPPFSRVTKIIPSNHVLLCVLATQSPFQGSLQGISFWKSFPIPVSKMELSPFSKFFLLFSFRFFSFWVWGSYLLCSLALSLLKDLGTKSQNQAGHQCASISPPHYHFDLFLRILDSLCSNSLLPFSFPLSFCPALMVEAAEWWQYFTSGSKHKVEN